MFNQFVCASREYTTYQKSVPAPIFRKTFQIEAIQPATLDICATGFYELFLNGIRITKGYLSPFLSNPEQVLFVDRYDLTDQLKSGENTLDVLLGNGFRNPIGGAVWGHTACCAAPSFALAFVCGKMTFSARDMLVKPSHILFDDYRVGVYCDKRRMIQSFPVPDFLGEWSKPLEAPKPQGEQRFTSCEPVREIRRIKAKKITPGALRDYRIRDCFDKTLYHGETVMGKTPVSGGYIYDFGENNAGIPCLKIKGTTGQKIEMHFTELMFEGFADYINVDVYPDGCCQRDVYICGCDREEQFIPPFTYHGFRYCYVYGITPEQATEDLLEYIVLHNDVEVRAGFHCSDPVSNEIFAACRRSDESNLMNVITDCPQREKNGWTGDVAVSASHYLLNLGVEHCLTDWLYCVRKTQRYQGDLAQVVPSASAAYDCPIWDSVIFQVPFYIYQYTGNTAVIRDNADSMIRNLRYYMSLRDQRGIVERGLGDWLPVDMLPAQYHSPLGFCCTVNLMGSAKMAEKMLRRIGRSAEAEECAQAFAELREAVRREYNDHGIITAGRSEKYRQPLYRICQTSQALGLTFGVFEPEEKDRALSCLITCIHEKNDAFDCGFLGLRYLFHVLSDNGYHELAYRMITRPAHPSYANMIYRGETTVWERFVQPGQRVGSHNHHFMADVSAWYLRHVAGIHVNPAWDDPNHILVAPGFIKSLNEVNANYKTPRGEIFVHWKRTHRKILLDVTKKGSVTVEYAPTLNTPEVMIRETNEP